jgi:hypothetical protein
VITQKRAVLKVPLVLEQNMSQPTAHLRNEYATTQRTFLQGLAILSADILNCPVKLKTGILKVFITYLLINGHLLLLYFYIESLEKLFI